MRSAGLFGSGPAGNRYKPAVWIAKITSRGADWPLTNVDKPTPLVTPKIRCIVAARRFVSISKTRFPDCAIETAKFAANVDFPSPATGLVT